jgi:hypothetical protein
MSNEEEEEEQGIDEIDQTEALSTFLFVPK